MCLLDTVGVMYVRTWMVDAGIQTSAYVDRNTGYKGGSSLAAGFHLLRDMLTFL